MPLLPPDHDYISDLEAAWEDLHEIAPADVALEMHALVLMEPDGTLVPVPLTHAGWRFYLDMADVRFPHDDGRNELPRPVVLIDLARHDAIAREKEGRAG